MNCNWMVARVTRIRNTLIENIRLTSNTLEEKILQINHVKSLNEKEAWEMLKRDNLVNQFLQTYKDK